MSQDNAGNSNLTIPVVVQTAINLKANQTDLTTHTANTSNPHSTTKAQVGLSNVDDTTDANKPISNATTTALNLKKDKITPITATTKGTATTVSVVQVNAQGDVVNLTEVVIQIPASQITGIDNYIKNLFAISGIFINSNTIEIVNSLPDPSLRIVANSITYSHLATALQTVIDSKAPLESPALTGTPTTTTAPVGTNTTQLSSCAFVRAEISTMIASLDVLVFKGVLNASTNPNYPLADAGNTYRVSVSGKIGGASGINVEVGDLLMCLVDGSVAGNQATVGMNWNISQVNIDGAVVGIDSVSTDNDFVVFSGTSGRIIKKITQGEFKTLLALAKADVGLANVDNTSDASKPISNATATALATKYDKITLTDGFVKSTAGATTTAVVGTDYFEGRLGANLASASTTTIGAVGYGETINITGSITINSFGISTTGTKRKLIFASGLIVNHNATSLICINNGNMQISSEDILEFVCINGALGYWKCVGYQSKLLPKRSAVDEFFVSPTSAMTTTVADIGYITERILFANRSILVNGTVTLNSTTGIMTMAQGGNYKITVRMRLLYAPNQIYTMTLRNITTNAIMVSQNHNYSATQGTDGYRDIAMYFEGYLSFGDRISLEQTGGFNSTIYNYIVSLFSAQTSAWQNNEARKTMFINFAL